MSDKSREEAVRRWLAANAAVLDSLVRAFNGCDPVAGRS